MTDRPDREHMSADAGEERAEMNNDLAPGDDAPRGSMGQDLPASDWFLIYPACYPSEGEMFIVKDRVGVEKALATDMVFGEKSVDALTYEHRHELDVLMEKFDNPDEWSGADLTWSFEDGAIHVVRISRFRHLLESIGRNKAAADDAGLPAASPGERSTPPHPRPLKEIE